MSLYITRSVMVRIYIETDFYIYSYAPVGGHEGNI